MVWGTTGQTASEAVGPIARVFTYLGNGGFKALYGYTMCGALASGEAGERGSLTPGKWADTAVLSGDPVSVEALALPDIRVEMSFVPGKLLYER